MCLHAWLFCTCISVFWNVPRRLFRNDRVLPAVVWLQGFSQEKSCRERSRQDRVSIRCSLGSSTHLVAQDHLPPDLGIS